MLARIPLLLSALAVSALAQDHPAHDEGLVLHEPKTGATLTLPETWSVATGEEGLMAASEDKRGFVLLIAAEKDFEVVREDVKALILSRLDNVVVAKSVVEGVNERGALEEVITAIGKGTSKRDGEEVEFAGLLIRSGETGALALGAWKDEANMKLVKGVLSSLHVKQSAGEGGLEITNTESGSSIVIPEGWGVIRDRKGLLATDPSGKAMAILMKWQGNFEESLTKMRSTLLTWVFKDVEIGEFAVIEASYAKDLGRVVAANGNAVDRFDEKPVEFTALRIQNVNEDMGAVLFGAWKDEQHAEKIEAMIASIKIQMPDAEK